MPLRVYNVTLVQEVLRLFILTCMVCLKSAQGKESNLKFPVVFL